MRNRSSVPVDSKRALASLCVSNSLGMIALYVSPMMLGAMTDGFRAREGTSGIVWAWELAVVAALSMLLAARYEKLDLHRWSWFGALAYLAGSLLSIWCVTEQQWIVFLVARTIVGAGEGILFGLSSGLAAQTALPVRTFAWLSGAHIAAAVLCYQVIPITTESLGPVGAFVTMAVVGLLGAPLMAWTPRSSTAQKRETPNLPEHRGIPVALLLLGVGSLNLGLNCLFPFTERLGVSIGFTLTEIGEILSLGAVLSILGPVAAGALGARHGRTLPLAFGSASQVAGSLALVYVTSHLLWAGSYILLSIALEFFVPLLYGLVAYYDRTGRINAAAASVTAWASAAGPLLSGLALNIGEGYRMIGWLTAVSYAAVFAFAYRPARAAEHAERLA